MTIKKTIHRRGIILKPDDVALEGIAGELKVSAALSRLQVYLEGATRTVVTTDQTQTLTSKTIDADTNTVSNLEVDNLKAGVLNTSTTLASASHTQIPSALAIKTYVDDKHNAQNEASEISFNDTVSETGQSTVQAAIDHIVTEYNSEIAGLKTSDTTIQGNITAHLNDAEDAHDASAISVVPAGNQSATNVQAALNELQSDIDTRATTTALNAHISQSVDAHDASAISLAAISGIEAVNVQAGIAELKAELDAEVATRSGADTTFSQNLTNHINSTTPHSTISGASIQSPSRLDAKVGTYSSLVTYAATASNGQFVYASDTKEMYQVMDGGLAPIGGAPIIKITAGENVAVNEVVYISTGTGDDSGRTAGRIYKADASNDDRVEAIGFVLRAASAGSIAEVQLSGYFKGLSGLTTGKMYFLSTTTPGAITSTASNTTGTWSVPLGSAISPTEIVINPVASASAIYILSSEVTFSLANNQSAATDVTGLLIDQLANRAFMIDYSIYRSTSSTALAQVGTLRGVYNSFTSTWLFSDDFAGENSGIEFSINPAGQVQYKSTNLAGTGYQGTLKYHIRRTFGV